MTQSGGSGPDSQIDTATGQPSDSASARYDLITAHRGSASVRHTPWIEDVSGLRVDPSRPLFSAPSLGRGEGGGMGLGVV